MRDDHNRNIALRYAEAGISVVPCSKKTPRINWRSGSIGSTTDAATIIRWWRVWPESLVAIDLHKCKLVVIDADRHIKEADGVAALSALLRSHHTDLRNVPITHTPGNGFHLYFRQPAQMLGNRAGELPDGIDVKGSGGLITAPGCIRPDGKRYRGVASHPDLITAFKTGIIPTMPPWLVEIIQARRQMPVEALAPAITTASGAARETAYARTALAGCASDLARLPQHSGRNNALNASAFRLGRMVARGWIARDEVEQCLRKAAVDCRLTADDGFHAVEATLRSGLDAGISQPHLGLRERR